MKKKENKLNDQYHSNDFFENPNAFNYSGYGDVDYSDTESNLNDISNNIESSLSSSSNNKMQIVKPNIEQVQDSSLKEKTIINEKIINLVELCVKQFFLKKENKKMLNEQVSKKTASNKILDIAKDSVISILGNILMGEDDKDEKAQNNLENESYNNEYSNILNSSSKKNVHDKKQLIKFKELQANLNLDNDTMIAILQEITCQNSYSFSFIKYNVDKSLLFFQDEFDHIFPVPLDKIVEYANLVNS